MTCTAATGDPSFLVWNEHSLCYRIPASSCVGVLAGPVSKGGRNPLNGPFFLSRLDRTRRATAKDFDEYRVVPPTDLLV